MLSERKVKKGKEKKRHARNKPSTLEQQLDQAKSIQTILSNPSIHWNEHLRARFPFSINPSIPPSNPPSPAYHLCISLAHAMILLKAKQSKAKHPPLEPQTKPSSHIPTLISFISTTYNIGLSHPSLPTLARENKKNPTQSGHSTPLHSQRQQRLKVKRKRHLQSPVSSLQSPISYLSVDGKGGKSNGLLYLGS